MRWNDHPAEQWTPVRYLRQDVECSFCRFTILKGSPGRTAGTRGTRCWWSTWWKAYECLGCRSEAVRAEIAWQAELDRREAQRRPYAVQGAA